ncbi:hypothetical protein JOL79_20460 [Microbispora sp. RL4-1S]|uniref:Secreted protein n=1 Tax=Microbispora oryzae TaxID=2806554 RepID=A0A940WIL7_9ACTN|nr:hypothetical protein [Microbispora oryzae]MBP2706186.1 hypothetical protein [Microbispora oryzae]
MAWSLACVLLCAWTSCFAPEAADASTVPLRSSRHPRHTADDGPVNSHNGNGRGNNNYSAVNSPTNMSGTQQISVSISTLANTQAAFCRKRTRGCKIVQNMSGHR